MMNEEKRQRLVAFLSDLPGEIRAKLESLKQEGITNRERSDFLWYHLIMSAATLGNSRGYFNLIASPTALESLEFAALAQLQNQERGQRIAELFSSAGIRYSNRKGRELSSNHDKITNMGGSKHASDIARSLSSKNEKLLFLKQFHGIGDKYGRNIWMDVYDPDFRQTVAIDQRIKRFSVVLGIDCKEYEQEEQEYVRIAMDAGLEPWELDRTLYTFHICVAEVLS
jgi:hypothetical protein